MASTEKHKTEVQLLFVKHTSMIRGFILSLLPDFNLADDVLQETFLVITEKASSFTLGTNFTAWACEIAKRKILELRRRDSRAAEVTLSDKAIEVLCEVSPEPVGVEEERAALANCIEKLAPRTRQIVKMRYGSGKRPSEIAQRLSWKPPAVYVALSRSRVFLKNCVEQKLGREVG